MRSVDEWFFEVHSTSIQRKNPYAKASGFLNDYGVTLSAVEMSCHLEFLHFSRNDK